MPTTDTATFTIAYNFACGMRQQLTEEQMQLVAASAVGPCPSHDYCDANMLMLAAFADSQMEFDSESDEHAALWNAAWDMARRNLWWCSGCLMDLPMIGHNTTWANETYLARWLPTEGGKDALVAIVDLESGLWGVYLRAPGADADVLLFAGSPVECREYADGMGG